jgi:hypothetical protein
MSRILYIILISIFSLSILSCAENSSDGSSSTSTMNDPNNTTPVTFTENVHSSLAESWVIEYNTIKENLLTIFPLYQKYYLGEGRRRPMIPKSSSASRSPPMILSTTNS